MNQNDIYLICLFGMWIFVVCQQYLRIRSLEKDNRKLMLEWQAWAAAKLQDFPTARLMAGIARQPDVKVEQSTGAKEKTEEFVIEQGSG